MLVEITRLITQKKESVNVLQMGLNLSKDA